MMIFIVKKVSRYFATGVGARLVFKGRKKEDGSVRVDFVVVGFGLSFLAFFVFLAWCGFWGVPRVRRRNALHVVGAAI
jgi:predicted permease